MENQGNINSIPEEKPVLNFIEEIIENDLQTGKNGKRVHTRFSTGTQWFICILVMQNPSA